MTAFNPIAALTAARHVQQSYADPNLWGRNAQGRVDYFPAVQIARLSIAGTNGRRDMLGDADFRAFDFGQGKLCHAGFLGHFRGVEKTIEQAIQGQPPGYMFDLAGHSLGGAVVALAVWRWPRFFAGSTVHLFGCPVVGNGNFAAEFDYICREHRITVFNVQARGDLVCSFNPRRWPHVGAVVHIGTRFDRTPDHPISAYVADLEAML